MSDIEPKSWDRSEVRCLSGYRLNERPIAFVVDEREIEVAAILESWREPDHVYFKVETKDGRVYDLRYNDHEDIWQIREGRRSRIASEKDTGF